MPPSCELSGRWQSAYLRKARATHWNPDACGKESGRGQINGPPPARSEACQSPAQCEQGQFEPVRHAALVEDAPQVMFDCYFTEAEAIGDVAVGQAVGKRHDNLPFAR